MSPFNEDGCLVHVAETADNKLFRFHCHLRMRWCSHDYARNLFALAVHVVAFTGIRSGRLNPLYRHHLVLAPGFAWVAVELRMWDAYWNEEVGEEGRYDA